MTSSASSLAVAATATSPGSCMTPLDGFMRTLLFELNSETIEPPMSSSSATNDDLSRNETIRFPFIIVSDNAISPSSRLLNDQRRRRRLRRQRTMGDSSPDYIGNSSSTRRSAVVRRHHSSPLETRHRQRHPLMMVSPELNPSRWEPSSYHNKHIRLGDDGGVHNSDKGLQLLLSSLQKKRMSCDNGGDGVRPLLSSSSSSSSTLSQSPVMPTVLRTNHNHQNNNKSKENNDRWGGVSRNNSDSAILLLRHTMMRPPRRTRDLPMMCQLHSCLTSVETHNQHQREQDDCMMEQQLSMITSPVSLLLASAQSHQNDETAEPPSTIPSKRSYQALPSKPTAEAVPLSSPSPSLSSNEWVPEGDEHFLQSILGSPTDSLSSSSSSSSFSLDDTADDLREPTTTNGNEDEKNDENCTKIRQYFGDHHDSQHHVESPSSCFLETIMDDDDDDDEWTSYGDDETGCAVRQGTRIVGTTVAGYPSAVDHERKTIPNNGHCYRQSLSRTFHQDHNNGKPHHHHHDKLPYFQLYDQILATLGFFYIAFQVMVQDFKRPHGGKSITASSPLIVFHHHTKEDTDNATPSSSSTSSSRTGGYYLGYDGVYNDNDADDYFIGPSSLLSCMSTFTVQIIHAIMQPIYVHGYGDDNKNNNGSVAATTIDIRNRK